MLVGPASSNDPTDGTWIQLMLTNDGNENWTPMGPYSFEAFEEGVKVAFRYDGFDADDWYLDNVCLSLYGQCDVLFEDFDDTPQYQLPDGWTVIEGIGDASGRLWEAHNDNEDSDMEVAIRYDSWLNMNKYLISPVVEVCGTECCYDSDCMEVPADGCAGDSYVEYTTGQCSLGQCEYSASRAARK